MKRSIRRLHQSLIALMQFQTELPLPVPCNLAHAQYNGFTQLLQQKYNSRMEISLLVSLSQNKNQNDLLKNVSQMLTNIDFIAAFFKRLNKKDTHKLYEHSTIWDQGV